MKKSIPFFLCSLLLTSFVTVGCDNGNSTNSSSNSKGLIPGDNRTAWFEWFDNINDAANFIVNLKNAQQNDDFNFGITEFDLLGTNEKLSINFFGFISGESSSTDDILNTKYVYFSITCIYIEKNNFSQSYNYDVEISFYPFMCDKKEFSNKNIKYNITGYENSLSDITFIYDDTTIMQINLSYESTKKINKEKLINELIENYKIIV